ncbi:hypothetical protein ACH5RR_029976 [Cinchona calisaya]|uniref:Uncharacterized protein n=1 Tax=Cinchona calisaya TaxID=153742 RepID=A0ABD2YT78_9GENT
MHKIRSIELSPLVFFLPLSHSLSLSQILNSPTHTTNTKLTHSSKGQKFLNLFHNTTKFQSEISPKFQLSDGHFHLESAHKKKEKIRLEAMQWEFQILKLKDKEEEQEDDN